MAVKFLDNTGLGYFWGKIKAWCNATFAAIAHTHTSYAVKHSYTTAAKAARNWYRIANANTSQTDASKTLHAQFIVTAYNTGQDTGYYERWFVDCEVFGRNAGIRIFGNTSAPFSQARVLYENTIASIDDSDRPAIDLYLNYVMNNAATTVTVEEVYNSGWTFVADGQLAASTVPSGFENVACSVRNNGVERSTYADYVSYLNRQISNITAAFTLADSYLYRSRTLNCTGTFTITIPSINSGYMWCVIKNKNATSGVITLHPSTTSVLIDNSNADIALQPGEYVCIHSAGANNYSLIADGRWKSKKADKATTLAGYGITDAKIANGTITLGSNSITPLISVPSHNQASNTINAMTGYSKPNSTSAITTGDTLNQAVGKLEAKVDAYDDSNYVHKTGDEIITGVKTFHRTILDGSQWCQQQLKVSAELDISIPSYPSTTRYGGFLFTDKNGSETGAIYQLFESSGIRRFRIRNFDNNSTGHEYIEIGYDPATGDEWAQAPATLASRNNGNDIVTRNWIPNDTRIVHTTGDESISGIKSFNSKVNVENNTWLPVQLRLPNVNYQNSSYPSSTVYTGIGIIDAGDHYPGDFYYSFNPDGSRSWILRQIKDDGTATTGLRYTYDPVSDKSFGSCNSPDLDVDDTKIPNTWWVRHATGNTTLNAATATTLASGSVLPVAKGGTGSSTQNFVDLSSTQKIYGNKAFGAYVLNSEVPNTTAGTAPSGDHYAAYEFRDPNGNYMAGLQFANSTTSNYLRLNTIAHNSTSTNSSWYFNASGSTIFPSTPNSPSAGQVVTYDWLAKDTQLVHTTGAESLAGNKTFTNAPIFRMANPYLYPRNTSEDYASTPSTNVFSALAFQDKDNDGLATIRHQKDTSNNTLLELMVRKHNSNDWIDILLSFESGGTKFFRGSSDNDISLGSTNRRWKQLFAGTTSISTSDERLKDNINEFNDDLLNAWDEINFYNFKFKDAISEKGDSARVHFGVIAQRIKTVFDKYDIDINNYGFFCYDSWDYQPAVVDDEGIPGQEELLAGDRYSIRYEELLCIEAAYQRHKNKILENRISELEKQVSDMLILLQNLTNGNG